MSSLDLSPEEIKIARTYLEGRVTRKRKGCWIWIPPPPLIHAYPMAYIGRKVLGWELATAAHRLSWAVYNGPIPDGLCVLHECDDCHCVSPRCLFLGTKADNSRDMVQKGRQARPRKRRLANHPLQEWNPRLAVRHPDHPSLSNSFGVHPMSTMTAEDVRPQRRHSCNW